MNVEAVKALAVKEFKDLIRDPRIIVPFVLSAVVLPVIGIVISAAMQAAVREALTAQKIAVVDMDGSGLSRELVQWLRGEGFSVVEVDGGDVVELAREAAREEAALLLLIQPGFSVDLASGRRPLLTVVQIVRDISLYSVPAASFSEHVGEFISRKLVESSGLSYELVKNPVNASTMVYVAAKDLMLRGPAPLAGLSMAAWLIPLILLSVSMVILQMAATSMAVENEERTLETTLTLPVSSFELLLSKLLGMFAVSLLSTVLQVAGMAAYFFILFSAPFMLAAAPAQGIGEGLAVAPLDIAFIAASLLISMFFIVAVGLILGALSRDVRIANTLAGPLSMLFYIPTFLVLFTPSRALGQIGRAVLYSLPVTQPVIAAKDIVSARLPAETPLYMLASLAITLVAVYATSKVFSLEALSSLQYRLSTLLARRRGKLAGRD